MWLSGSYAEKYAIYSSLDEIDQIESFYISPSRYGVLYFEDSTYIFRYLYT